VRSKFLQFFGGSCTGCFQSFVCDINAQSPRIDGSFEAVTTPVSWSVLNEESRTWSQEQDEQVYERGVKCQTTTTKRQFHTQIEDT
jgi:hypothetical protein